MVASAPILAVSILPRGQACPSLSPISTENYSLSSHGRSVDIPFTVTNCAFLLCGKRNSLAPPFWGQDRCVTGGIIYDPNPEYIQWKCSGFSKCPCTLFDIN